MRGLKTREESMPLSLTAYANIATFIGSQCRVAGLHRGLLSFGIMINCCLYYYLVWSYNAQGPLIDRRFSTFNPFVPNGSCCSLLCWFDYI